MKRILTIILLFTFSFSLMSFTNDNFVEEYVVYFSDLKNIDEDWSQEQVYDYYYECTLKNQISLQSEQYDIFGWTLTTSELALVALYPQYAIPLAYTRNKAIEDTQFYFPNNCGDGDYGNAFQHCYWTMLLCYSTTPEFALDFTTAHENYDGNSELHKNMDLTNNKVAYDYYLINTPLADSQCAMLALDLFNNAKLTYIIFNYRYLKQVNIVISSGKRREIYAYGNFYAYTTTTTPYNVPSVIYNYVNIDIDGPIA